MTRESEIFTPTPDRDIMRQAELLALRHMSESLNAMTAEMIGHREALVTIKTDVAVIKERQKQHAEMQETIDDLKARLTSVENRNLRQDGAMSLVTFLKEFGPWIVSLVVLGWAFLTRRPL